MHKSLPIAFKIIKGYILRVRCWFWAHNRDNWVILAMILAMQCKRYANFDVRFVHFASLDPQFPIFSSQNQIFSPLRYGCYLETFWYKSVRYGHTKWCTKDFFDNRYSSQVKLQYRLIFASIEIWAKSFIPICFSKNALSNEPTKSFVAKLGDE